MIMRTRIDQGYLFEQRHIAFEPVLDGRNDSLLFGLELRGNGGGGERRDTRGECHHPRSHQ